MLFHSQIWPMKVEHELKLNRTKMSMIRWMCGVKLIERKKSDEFRELLGLEPVSLTIKKSRLRWFGHVERKDDNDWVKRCMAWEVEGIRQRGRPKKTWDCVEDCVESLGLSHRMCSLGINGEGELRGQLTDTGSPGKVAVKMEYVCACLISFPRYYHLYMN